MICTFRDGKSTKKYKKKVKNECYHTRYGILFSLQRCFLFRTLLCWLVLPSVIYRIGVRLGQKRLGTVR